MVKTSHMFNMLMKYPPQDRDGSLQCLITTFSRLLYQPNQYQLLGTAHPNDFLFWIQPQQIQNWNTINF
jgi:hypothetical protein